ncbi:Eukaryotic translation initiation factor 3 subunit L [Blattella germanica]|nr:Eukaryotic translation initiation factor 3 subunit L [Blattella germanica]
MSYGNDDYQETFDYGYGGSMEYDGHGVEGPTDAEYDRSTYTSIIPDMVKSFLLYFKNCINEGLIYEIQNIYETSFPKLTEQYFAKEPWPNIEDVKELVDNDGIFMMLYKELYFRHLYARVSGCPTVEQRFASFMNYCELFNYILDTQEPVPLELPDQWLWELVDEFVYQFQSYTQYHGRLQKKTKEELEQLGSYKMWNVYASGGDPDSVAGDYGHHSLYKMLGYFSLVGLMRVHSLFGDYYQAIKVLENIELNKKISTSYYVGFAYMMMRRYSDAIRTFSSILLYIQRTKQLYLKLYTTLPLSKLASFMNQSQIQGEINWEELQKDIHHLVIDLLCFKHKMKNIVWTKGTSGLEGKFQSGSELDFYIDNEMIHIADTKVAHRYGDFFIRKILKFEDLNRKLHMIKI